jgi:hypothetical protein
MNYFLQMSNLAREIQYTNLAELFIMDHPDHTKLLIDKYGKIHTCSAIREPESAVDGNGNSVLNLITREDSLLYFPAPSGKDDKLMDEMVLTFRKPENCTEGKLFIRARNSVFLDYSFASYMGLFGDKLPVWQEKMGKRPVAELKKWNLEQGIPLSVYIEKNGIPEYIDNFETPGPMTFRNDMLKIDLSGLEGSEIKVRLTSGKLFWEIDRIGMDFSEESITSLEIIKPFKAVDQDSVDILNQILRDDNSYYIQPEPGDEAEISFRVPDSEIPKNFTRSVFLHSKGHYRILGNAKEEKSLFYLSRFKKPESFTRFARDNYFSLMESALN